MIRNSFIFLEKVGRRKEQSIWAQKITNWQEFLGQAVKGISKEKKSYYNRQVTQAATALQQENSSYFIGKLPPVEMWRLYHYFKEDSCFLDIEAEDSGKITLVGISNYYESNFFVRNINLDVNLLARELSKYKIIITFNGGAFDLPKLRKELGLQINIPHIDLKPLCVNLNLTGGLKEVEQILNLKRPSNLYGNPIDLWKAFHASGDREYLDLLIEYNREDCENLKHVMDHVYGKMKEKTFISINYFIKNDLAKGNKGN